MALPVHQGGDEGGEIGFGPAIRAARGAALNAGIRGAGETETDGDCIGAAVARAAQGRRCLVTHANESVSWWSKPDQAALR